MAQNRYERDCYHLDDDIYRDDCDYGNCYDEDRYHLDDDIYRDDCDYGNCYEDDRYHPDSEIYWDDCDYEIDIEDNYRATNDWKNLEQQYNECINDKSHHHCSSKNDSSRSRSHVYSSYIGKKIKNDQMVRKNNKVDDTSKTQ